MAKSPKAQAAATQELKVMSKFTIQGVEFGLDDKYAEGHALTANEASALNQLRAENIGNNLRAKVKAVKDSLPEGTAVDINTDYTVTSGEGDAAKSETINLGALFNQYAGSYEFGARRVGGGTGKRVGDPVEREARRIAREKVETAIKTKYGKLNAVPREKVEELVSEHAKSEVVLEQARKNVGALGDIDLGLEL